MFRWAVDITGIDLATDVQRGQIELSDIVPLNHTDGRWHVDSKCKQDRVNEEDCLGKVWVLKRDELMDLQEARATRSFMACGPFKTYPSQASLQGERGSNSPRSIASPDPDVVQGRNVRVFCTFINPQGRRTAVNLVMMQPTYRGVDVINTYLQKVVVPDERLSQRYSCNPRLYKLHIADEFTGEEEMALQLDVAAQNFSCYAISPLPAAKLFLFPQRTELLPPSANDLDMTVQIRPMDPQGKMIKRQSIVPADMLAENLEATLVRRLPTSGIIPGSLRIKYGPLELNINETYNFGAGCGQINCPIAEHTMLTLSRFGVTEVVVNGRAAEEAPEESLSGMTEDIVIDMSTEEAMALQKFEVVCINQYGARQQRLLCVDGEHMYTIRPNASETMPKTTERMIKDIEEVRTFSNRPKYLEIAYTWASRYKEDHLEFTTPYNCALLEEKLRVVRRELRKREAGAANSRGQTVFRRLLHWLQVRGETNPMGSET